MMVHQSYPCDWLVQYRSVTSLEVSLVTSFQKAQEVKFILIEILLFITYNKIANLLKNIFMLIFN